MVRTRIFFVSDVHGSDRCFRKFVNAGKFYGANVLILGGDITAKVLVPFVRNPDGSHSYDDGSKKRMLRSPAEIEEAMKGMRDSGYYPCVMGPEEYSEMSSRPELLKELFKKAMIESLKSWMALAEDRLQSTGIRCYVSPGNDDFFEIDEVLNSSSYVVNPEEKVVKIDDEHEMITLGFANRTPWNSPREVDEEILQAKIDSMAGRVHDMRKAIFNLHVPPIDTPLDQAPKLTRDFKPAMSGGNVVMASAGSVAVRKSIETYQPLIGIHGHIHESRGAVKLGRTTCFNPGSEYSSGILKGLIADLDGDSIRSYLLTAG